MQENTLADAVSIVTEEFDPPEFINSEMVDFAATELATWCFESIARAAEENPEDGVPEDVQIAAVRNAVAAAYIAGCLDTATNQPVTQAMTVAGKSGAIYNFYFN